MDPGAAETGCKQNLCHFNGKNGERIVQDLKYGATRAVI